MSTLLLLRHGQAAFGTDHYDRLSPLGLQQAEATGRFLAARGAVFDQVLSGPRQRQQATAAAVLGQLPSAPEVQTLAALDEFADGDQVLAVARARAGGIELAGTERMRHYMATIRAWGEGEVEIPKAPSAADFHRRAEQWLHGLMAFGASGRRLLAVTSAGTTSALLCAALRLPPARMADFMGAIHNASLTEIVFSRERCSLRQFNGSGHLPAELLTLM